jgi:VIT1/CCC1 family predicted Fe2+/Mn2+ transporter
MADRFDLPADKDLAKMIVQAEAQRTDRSMRLGKIGAWFGTKENAATYAAGFMAAFFAVIIALVLFVPIGEGLTRPEALQIVGGFFLAALGYLFGSIKGGD